MLISFALLSETLCAPLRLNYQSLITEFHQLYPVTLKKFHGLLIFAIRSRYYATAPLHLQQPYPEEGTF
jgi:hypothetical protein